MFPVVAGIGLGVNLLSSAASWLGGMAQEGEAQKARNEEMRRMKAQQDAALGTARARAAASGVEVGAGTGSMSTYLAQMAEEYRRQQDFARSAAGTQHTANLAGGAFKFGADVGQSLLGYASANNWWK